MRVTRSATGLGSLLARATFLVAAVHMIGGGLARADSKSEKADAVAVGYEIFNREWLPNDPQPRRRRAGASLQRFILRGLPQLGGKRRRGAGQQEHRYPQRIA